MIGVGSTTAIAAARTIGFVGRTTEKGRQRTIARGALVYESRMNEPRCEVRVDKLGKLARLLGDGIRLGSSPR